MNRVRSGDMFLASSLCQVPIRFLQKLEWRIEDPKEVATQNEILALTAKGHEKFNRGVNEKKLWWIIATGQPYSGNLMDDR